MRSLVYALAEESQTCDTYVSMPFHVRITAPTGVGKVYGGVSMVLQPPRKEFDVPRCARRGGRGKAGADEGDWRPGRGANGRRPRCCSGAAYPNRGRRGRVYVAPDQLSSALATSSETLSSSSHAPSESR